MKLVTLPSLRYSESCLATLLGFVGNGVRSSNRADFTTAFAKSLDAHCVEAGGFGNFGILLSGHPSHCIGIQNSTSLKCKLIQFFKNYETLDYLILSPGYSCKQFHKNTLLTLTQKVQLFGNS